jgi:hypothetical protein
MANAQQTTLVVDVIKKASAWTQAWELLEFCKGSGHPEDEALRQAHSTLTQRGEDLRKAVRYLEIEIQSAIRQPPDK